MKVSVITAAAAFLGLAQAAPLTAEITKRGVAANNFDQVFSGLSASTSDVPNYITLKTLTSYDVDACAQKCLDNSPSVCVFFNIYIEHNHSGDAYHCALYRAASTAAQATNAGGQVREGVVTTKSDSAGYAKKPPVPGYTAECYGNAAINHPSGSGTYMGNSYTPQTPQECAAACDAKTNYNYNQADPGATYRACNFFNFYTATRDGVFYRYGCAFYLVSYDASYATNFGGQVRGPPDYVSGYTDSCGYTRDVLIGVNGIGTKPGPTKE